MRVFVTVGMSGWPFDRLMRALEPVCKEHQVFVQCGSSKVAPPCPHAAFLSPTDVMQRIRTADVVITHAGNTVRLVQRAGKVPIAVARTAGDGEMPNDHQVEYLRHEERSGRVVAVWDVSVLPRAVNEHPRIESRVLAERSLDDPSDSAHVAAVLDLEWQRIACNPFRRHPLRRYTYAWSELCDLAGAHLDVGCNTGTFIASLAATTRLRCFGVDPHAGYVRVLRRDCPGVGVIRIGTRDPLPFQNGAFNSVSALDVLEHCNDEDALLREIHRVLRPGGLLVLTVPARHRFSWMDPDNIKFRWPELHRIGYSLRFGRARYRQRFVDRSNGLFGEMSVGKREHTNYRWDWLSQHLQARGFEVTRRSGANLFWRWFQIPSLLLPQAWRAPLDWAMRLDGELFHTANHFVTARRVS